MIQITCPHCGPRAQGEFVYERTVDSVVMLDAPPEEAIKSLFTRNNPRGGDEEIWRHTFGCRAWMVITRHRVTNDISATRAVGPEVLP
jgi:heterotetrameric sarcosine oxidase delta subunit